MPSDRWDERAREILGPTPEGIDPPLVGFAYVGCGDPTCPQCEGITGPCGHSDPIDCKRPTSRA